MDMENVRKFKRIDFSGEIKVRIPEEDKEMSVGIKDISQKGVRIIIGRALKMDQALFLRMRVNDREIQCYGRVAWVLTMRPSLGNISIFDVGIEFTKVNAGDQEFLEKLFGA